jgi:predicted CXXCH cytochrome family protein
MILLLILVVPVQSEQCGLCHPDVRALYQNSIHAQESTSCTDCHGGNPNAVSTEAAHRGSFRGTISRRDVPRFCAECHSDPQRMRPYNLSTDQYALYQISQHGMRLADGDTRIAVCTDCHGTHNILSPENPESRVFVENIPDTCGRCHGDPELMARYGKDTAPYQDYLQSIHAEELLERGNDNAPECSRCHGIHGAAAPGVGDVDKVCGSCHTAARLAFQEGPHLAGMLQAGLPECVSCHGNHSVQVADREDLALLCAGCHGQDSSQVTLGEKMEVLFQRAQEEIDQARQLIAEAEEIPLYVEDYQARLQEARTYLLEAEPAVHTVSLEAMEKFTRTARSLGEEVQSEIQGKLGERRLRRLGLMIFWFYVVLTIWILWRFRQRALREAK